MRSIRAGNGLGDAIYLQSIVRHFVERGERLVVKTSWPDVFRPLGGKVDFAPFSRSANIRSHYAPRKRIAGTDQFEDMAIAAGLTETPDLRLDWIVTNNALVEFVLETAAGRPICLVQLPRYPMDRKDGFGIELLPDCRVTQRVIDALKDRALLVQIGAGTPLYEFNNIGLDLANRTSVCELLDVASIADGGVGHCSFLTPLLESFKRPGLFVWSRCGVLSSEPYIRTITPEKILHRDSSQYVFDDAPKDRIRALADAFLR